MGEASLTGRTLAGLKWAGLSAVGQAVLTVSIVAVLARLLTPEDFGLVAIAMIFVTAAQNLGHRNIGAAIVQRAELTDRHIAAGVTLSIGAGGVFAAALWGLAPGAGRFFGEPAVAPILRALSAAVVCTGLGTVPEYLWRRRLRFRALTAAELVAQALGYGLVAIAMALSGYGVWALVAGTVMRQAVFAAAVLTTGPRLPRPALSRHEARELLGAGAGFSSIAAFNLIANQGSRLLVGRLLGATPLGYYTRSTALASLSGHLGRVLGKVLFPAMAQRQRHTERLAAAYLNGVEILSWLAVPAGLLLAVCAAEIVAVVLGGQWQAAVPVLEILAIGTAFRIGASLNAPLGRAMGALRQMAWRGAVNAAVLVAGVAAGSRWGLNGVAVAAVGALMLSWWMMTQLTVSLLGLGWGAVLRRHVPALWAGAWGAPALWLTAVLVREAGWPAAAALAAQILAWSAAAAVAVWYAPPLARPAFIPWSLAALPSRGWPARRLHVALGRLARRHGH